MTFGSLFAGIGGIDLGLERAGLECAWQIERDKQCRKVLERWWPNVDRFDDVRNCEPSYADVLAGGDPCPSHSKARSIWGSKHPDLSGYFLAMVGRLRPRWVVRENVPSPSSRIFAAALDALGYGTMVVAMDGADITDQSRQREFVVGGFGIARSMLKGIFLQRQNDSWAHAEDAKARPVAACLTTHPCRYDTRDNYVWEPAGFRILDADEREALAGFPRGWTAGFPKSTRARFYGNCCIPRMTEWIGTRIMEAHAGQRVGQGAAGSGTIHGGNVSAEMLVRRSVSD